MRMEGMLDGKMVEDKLEMVVEKEADLEEEMEKDIKEEVMVEDKEVGKEVMVEDKGVGEEVMVEVEEDKVKNSGKDRKENVEDRVEKVILKTFT